MRRGAVNDTDPLYIHTKSARRLDGNANTVEPEAITSSLVFPHDSHDIAFTRNTRDIAALINRLRTSQ